MPPRSFFTPMRECTNHQNSHKTLLVFSFFSCIAAMSSSSPFPSIIPPPPPPPETSFHHHNNFHRSASSHHLNHHHHNSPSHHHNHHHHHHSSIDLDDRGHDSMDNLVGTHQHHHQSRGYNTHHSVFRGQFQDGGRGGGGGEQFGRWRSRSSPPVARRLKSWATSQNDLTHMGDAYDDDAIGRPRTNFHSSFHDLHLANEARASRHDLSQMREEVVRGFRGGGGERSSRRNFRKWPLPPPGGKGSPSCRRCEDEGRFF